MPVGPFEQLIGAAGDVKELEYISALHQTDCDQLRRDCSIKADDIRLFLSSRYGIVVDNETVDSLILSEFGGSGVTTLKKDEEVLDLMEIVALLIIPTLLKARLQASGEDLPDGVIKTPPGLISYVLKMILHDTTGSSSSKPLNADLLKSILTAYGEEDLANNNELIESMLQATDGAPFLNAEAFADALTSDVRIYDISNEVRLTTLYEDVFVSQRELELSLRRSTPRADRDVEEEAEGGATMNRSMRFEPIAADKEPFTRRWMAPSIDVTADLYRSKMLVVFLWSTILISYFAYIWLGQSAVIGGDCECRALYNHSFTGSYSDNSDVMLCQLTLQIFRWLFLFAIISFFGLILITVGSIGNYVGSPLWQPLVGGSLVLLFSVTPFYMDMQRKPDMTNTTMTNNTIVLDQCNSAHNASAQQQRLETRYLVFMAMVLGVITAAFHFFHVLTELIPRGCLKDVSWVKDIVSRKSMFGEMHTKQAGSFKLSQMMSNALHVVRINDESTTALNTHFAQALGEFAKSGRQYRSVGGFRWTWKHLWNKSAYRKDGIWLSTRMISSNIAQWIVTMYVLFRGIKLTKDVTANYADDRTKKAFLDWAGSTISTSSEDALVNATTGQTTILFGTFLASQSNTTSLNCPSASASELVSQYCTNVGGQYVCNPPNWSPACALLLNTSGLTTLQTKALLDASGFDPGLIANTTRAAIHKASEQAVNSIYPAQQYMVTAPFAIATGECEDGDANVCLLVPYACTNTWYP
jgi:hypothetical protein